MKSLGTFSLYEIGLVTHVGTWGQRHTPHDQIPQRRQSCRFYLLQLVNDFFPITAAPLITTNPLNQSVREGDNAILWCNASGDPVPTISRKKDKYEQQSLSFTSMTLSPCLTVKTLLMSSCSI